MSPPPRLQLEPAQITVPREVQVSKRINKAELGKALEDLDEYVTRTIQSSRDVTRLQTRSLDQIGSLRQQQRSVGAKGQYSTLQG